MTSSRVRSQHANTELVIGICPRTRKLGFASRADVKRWLRSKRGEVQGRHAYDCPFCPYWHFTRQEQRTKRKLRMPSRKARS